MIRRRYFGRYENGAFFLSLQPPDAPVRPSARYETADEIKALLTQRRVAIFWWPPLPDAIHAEIQEGLRMEAGREGDALVAPESGEGASQPVRHGGRRAS